MRHWRQVMNFACSPLVDALVNEIPLAFGVFCSALYLFFLAMFLGTLQFLQARIESLEVGA